MNNIYKLSIGRIFKAILLSQLFFLIPAFVYGQCSATGSTATTLISDNGDGTCTYDVVVTFDPPNNTTSVTATIGGITGTCTIGSDCNIDPGTGEGTITVQVTTTCDATVAGEIDFTRSSGPVCNLALGNISLPVEFLYLNAQPENKYIKLKWATASEINNDYFSVEYSRDGIGFKEVGRIKGVGNSVETVEYEYMHEAPNAGNNYYRLLQVDFDGTSDYSDVVVVNKSTGDQAVSIHPNTVQGVMNVYLNQTREKDTRGVIYDVVGSKVQDVTIPAGATQTTVDIANLPTGHYFFRIQTGVDQQVVRFVKSNP